ncbi:GIN domain-containing protein [Winogradskyella aurantiaca]|uniref:GIN domain-containing protein n=1 Tax=Winogradskyella aurantiaca TaxID=2219558 RepID=UPI000E1C7D5B|nr:DUF2807 domain-containing protein [Winogradskyella aurantiaca]
MKKLFYLLVLVGTTSLAQIKGNKNIETKNYEVSNLEVVKVNIYAKVIIDQSAPEGITITTDSNLFEYFDTEVIDGVLNLDQIKWISPSQDAKIVIGAPNLKRVEHSTHDSTKIVNINNDALSILATVGNIELEGTTKELRIGCELATVDASNIVAQEVYVNLWKWGTVKVGPVNKLSGEVSNDGKLLYTQKPSIMDVKTKSSGVVLPLEESYSLKNPEAVYIRFKIKNNSDDRHNFKVVGPKPEGGKFGYGFPMNPNAIRKENWTVGTKIYKVNGLGFKKLIRAIELEDEGKTVSLFN